MKNGFTFDVAGKGKTTARIYRARDPLEVTLILAHGAGAGQSHPFMIAMAKGLAKAGIDVVTFDFVYMHAGKKLPDRTDDLEACWRAAIASVRARSGLSSSRLFIGGKSMGGRIASHLAAAGDGLVLAGLVFLGYPLHPKDKPQVRRDAHLPRVPFPMLFVQGTRDELGNDREMRALVRKLPGAELHLVKGVGHMFAESAYDEMIAAVARFLTRAHPAGPVL